eukprot:scaffold92055_cov33-Tisochrysis_lutea.AAC.8
MHPATFLLRGDTEEELAKAAEQIIIAVGRGGGGMLEAARAEGQAVVERLQHRIAVAGIAKVLETKVVLRLGELCV